MFKLYNRRLFFNKLNLMSVVLLGGGVNNVESFKGLDFKKKSLLHNRVAINYQNGKWFARIYICWHSV